MKLSELSTYMTAIAQERVAAKHGKIEGQKPEKLPRSGRKNRTEILKLRVTPEEKEAILQCAPRGDFSTYARNVLLGKWEHHPKKDADEILYPDLFKMYQLCQELERKIDAINPENNSEKPRAIAWNDMVSIRLYVRDILTTIKSILSLEE